MGIEGPRGNETDDLKNMVESDQTLRELYEFYVTLDDAQLESIVTGTMEPCPSDRMLIVANLIIYERKKERGEKPVNDGPDRPECYNG